MALGLDSYPDLTFDVGDVLEATYDGRYSDTNFAPLNTGDRVLITEKVEEEDHGPANLVKRTYEYVIIGEEGGKRRRVAFQGVGSDGTRWGFQNGKAHAPYQMELVEDHPANQ